MNPKIVSKTRLKKILQESKNKKIVFTNGCFDLIHLGHIRYLQKAKALGDILIVAINTDSSVRKLKGKGRPIIPQNDRAEILAALECVDYVTYFNELTPARIIRYLRPNILVKGADYKLEEIVGKDIVTSFGGIVKTISLVKGRSTSDIIRKIGTTPIFF